MLRNARLSAASMTVAMSGFLGCATLQQNSSPAYDGWSLLAALPASNSETGVAAVDGKIYVVGGYPSDRKTVATVQVYDSAVA